MVYHLIRDQILRYGINPLQEGDFTMKDSKLDDALYLHAYSLHISDVEDIISDVSGKQRNPVQ